MNSEAVKLVKLPSSNKIRSWIEEWDCQTEGGSILRNVTALSEYIRSKMLETVNLYKGTPHEAARECYRNE